MEEDGGAKVSPELEKAIEIISKELSNISIKEFLNLLFNKKALEVYSNIEYDVKENNNIRFILRDTRYNFPNQRFLINPYNKKEILVDGLDFYYSKEFASYLAYLEGILDYDTLMSFNFIPI